MNEEKPTIKLVGRDGNAFAILAECRRAARRAGWESDKINDMLNEMMSGDYNHLLVTAMRYFEVE